MSYQPSLKDITQTPSQTSGGYRPSLSDIGVMQPNAQEPSNQLMGGYKLPSYPFVTRPSTEQEKQRAGIELNEFTKGATQSYLNTPEEAANVFGKHLYNKFNYAPNTEAAKLGAYGGDFSSYFLPSTLLKIPLKVAKLFPKAKTAINTISALMKERPITNALLSGSKI